MKSCCRTINDLWYGLMKIMVLTAVALLALGSIPREEPGILASGNLEGTWEQVSGCDNGRTVPSRGYTWFFRDGYLNILVNGRTNVACRYTTNTATAPPSIDLAGRLGIYVIDGDTLKLCISSNQFRPVSFAGKNAGEETYTFKRITR